MSTLTDNEKRYFEKLLDMQGGYVLDYTDKTFEEFFKRYNIDIHHQKYHTYGTSKAKKLRSFWEQELDEIVARILSELTDAYEANCDFKNQEIDEKVLNRCRQIIERICDLRSSSSNRTDIKDDFCSMNLISPIYKSYLLIRKQFQ